MPLINGSLQIGRSGLSASQAALAVTGNNIANAATASYSRQTVHMAPTQYSEVQPGRYTGTGVTIYDIRRRVDEALNARIRTAISDSESNLVLQQAMSRVEATLNELTDNDISSRLNAFFTAWSDLQDEPTNVAKRQIVIERGGSLASRLRSVRSEFSGIQDDLDAQVRVQVEQVNTLLTQIADLNGRIVSTEAGKINSASALRDQRDELLQNLSKLINIRTQVTASGALNVYVGSSPAIQDAEARAVGYVEREDANGKWLAQIVFTDKNQILELQSGRLHGMINARDAQVGTAIGDLDDWTSNLILEVNKLHSSGQSAQGFQSMTSFFSVDDETASLADTTDTTGTGLPWAVTNGNFSIHVYKDGKEVDVAVIKIDIGMGGTDTTLQALETSINNAGISVTATIDSSNRLRIDAGSGFTFKLSGPANADGSSVLAVLGMNTFFQGENADDIYVKTGLAANNVAISANGSEGNGDVAGRIAQLTDTGISNFNGASLTDQYASYVSKIGGNTRQAQDNYTAADVIVQTLQSERQAISGVSIDEEAIHMIMYQRAFQGAARYISLIDKLLDEVIALAG